MKQQGQILVILVEDSLVEDSLVEDSQCLSCQAFVGIEIKQEE